MINMGKNKRMLFKIKKYPFLGNVKIWVKHDPQLGRCWFEMDGREVTTPNMPKLRYAIYESQFLRGNIIPKEQLIGKEFYIFEKIDGFNLLFWAMDYNGRVLIFPKTRMLPYAHGTIIKVISDPLFPLARIKQMMLEQNVYPVFEVWGRLLEELGIIHGAVEYTEDVPYIEPILIGAINPETLEFLHPQITLNLAEKYGFKTSFIRKQKLEYADFEALMNTVQEYNQWINHTLTEGMVLHGVINGEVQMYKLKPHSVMQRDMAKGVTQERILLELSKYLLEQDPKDAARELDETFNAIIKYIQEDTQVTATQIKLIRTVVATRLAEYFDPQEWTPEKMGRAGVHGMVIGYFIKKNNLK